MPDDLGRPERVRLIVIGVMTAIILGFVNLQIAAKERIVREGTTVLLRLAPVDPRSLMQGDYMALRYAMARDVAKASEEAGVRDGKVVIDLDENREAQYIDIYKEQPLAGNQQLLVFRTRGESVRGPATPGSSSKEPEKLTVAPGLANCGWRRTGRPC